MTENVTAKVTVPVYSIKQYCTAALKVFFLSFVIYRVAEIDQIKVRFMHDRAGQIELRRNGLR